MFKAEFLDTLRRRLEGLPHSVIMESLEFYSEMIDDRIEEGLTEEEAVNSVGSVDEIASQIIAETPISKIVKERLKPTKKLSALTIVLLILGSPIWLSLAIAAFAVLISVFAVLFSVIITLWAVTAALAACFIGCIIGGIISIAFTSAPSGLLLISVGLVCASLSIFAFLGCRATTKGITILSKNIIIKIKNMLFKGGKK